MRNVIPAVATMPAIMTTAISIVFCVINTSGSFAVRFSLRNLSRTSSCLVTIMSSVSIIVPVMLLMNVLN